MQKKHLRILATAACLSAGLHFPPMGKRPFPLFRSPLAGMVPQKAEKW